MQDLILALVTVLFLSSGYFVVARFGSFLTDVIRARHQSPGKMSEPDDEAEDADDVESEDRL
ncbi:MAG: hypothetical protein K6D90_02820 [Lachnospiraceae bacterium]|nr:hypothetical protein [Lachnospiraceae bacterium]